MITLDNNKSLDTGQTTQNIAFKHECIQVSSLNAFVPPHPLIIIIIIIKLRFQRVKFSNLQKQYPY